MKKAFLLFTLFNSFVCFCQEIPNFAELDSLYREDQFYVDISYNFLRNKPKDVIQNSFSTGINIGFLRDFPINKLRTFAIAPGLGLSYNNYKQNLFIDKDNTGIVDYKILTEADLFDKNKFSLYYADLPIEFRWRNSTFESHKFYRTYFGFKLSYLVYRQSRFVSSSKSVTIDANPDFNKILYSIYAAVGNNSVNVFVNYGLNSIFKQGIVNNEPIKMFSLNIGLMFYIL